MLFVLLILWTVGLVIMIADPRKKTVRWLSALVFCGGCGALSALIGDYILPYGEAHGYRDNALKLLDKVQILSSLLQYYGLPFTYIMFALRYHPQAIPARWRAALPYVLPVPAAAILLSVQPPYPIPYRLVVWWAVPLVIAGTFLIFSKRETLYTLRRNHIYTALAVAPAVCFSSVMNYVLPSLGFQEMWRYNTWAIALAFAVFVVAIFKFGFLDIQFLLTRKKLDISIRAVTSGTAVLNHAIKNDVGKMRLFSAKIRAYAEESGQPELLEDIGVIESAASHIHEMILRVKEQTQELPLRLETFEPASMLRELERQNAPAAAAGRHRLVLELQEGIRLVGDRAQTAEACQNIVSNALEAMPDGGQLNVKLYDTPKWTVIEFRDTGCGMEKEQVKRAMEPFYTTKTASNRNFGLGLSYAYHVMKKHKGNLFIQSKPGAGTAVTLSFPRKKGKHGTNPVVDRGR